MKSVIHIFSVLSMILFGALEAKAEDAVKWRVYQNETWNFSLEYPPDWTVETMLTNVGKPHHVVKEKIAFTGPAGPMICLDVWTNDKGMKLMEWFRAYQAGMLSSGVKIPNSPNAVAAGEKAIRLYNPQHQACDQLIHVFEKQGRFFRLEYRITDDRKSDPVVEHMLSSFK